MKPRGRGIPGLPSLDIPKAVAATLDEAMAGIRERHATLSKLTKFSPSSAYWRRLHMDIGVLLEAYDRQILLLDTVSPSTVEGAAAYVKMKARADRAEAALAKVNAMLGEAVPDDYDEIKAQLAAANERWAQLKASVSVPVPLVTHDYHRGYCMARHDIALDMAALETKEEA